MAGGVAENVGGSDIRTLLRRVGAPSVVVVELPETSLPNVSCLGGGCGDSCGVRAATGVSSSQLSRPVAYDEIDVASSSRSTVASFDGMVGA